MAFSWEQKTFSDISFPITHIGDTDMVFSILEPVVLTTENITTDSVYTITDQGKIIEASPSSVLEVANAVRDVYVHTDDVPIEVNITLDAGSICVTNLSGGKLILQSSA